LKCQQKHDIITGNTTGHVEERDDQDKTRREAAAGFVGSATRRLHRGAGGEGKDGLTERTVC
jgi:hypothetical protein